MNSFICGTWKTKAQTKEKQTTDTEDKQVIARGAGSGSGEKKEHITVWSNEC